MNMTIRPANLEGDPAAVAEILNAADPHPVTPEQVRAWFTHLPAGRVSRRRVAVDASGRVTGYSAAVHEAFYPPGEYSLWVAVRPEQRGQGIGSRLYADALDFARTQGATSLRSEVREDCPEGRRFAEQRGFRVNRHLFESVLDLNTFDETPYLPLMEHLDADGVRFFCMADTPDREEDRRKLYELNRAVGLDIPGSKEFPDYEEFDGLLFNAPWYQPAGQLLAAVGERWVGLSSVQLMPEAGGAYNVITGVLREFRGRKIARGLKVRAVRYARQHGAAWMRTDNDSLNAPVLAINREMGYRPEPGKFTLAREME